MADAVLITIATDATGAPIGSGMQATFTVSAPPDVTRSIPASVTVTLS